MPLVFSASGDLGCVSTSKNDELFWFFSSWYKFPRVVSEDLSPTSKADGEFWV